MFNLLALLYLRTKNTALLLPSIMMGITQEYSQHALLFSRSHKNNVPQWKAGNQNDFLLALKDLNLLVAPYSPLFRFAFSCNRC